MNTKRLKAVTMFYSLAIERIKSMSPSQLSRAKLFSTLRNIDKEVAMTLNLKPNTRIPF